MLWEPFWHCQPDCLYFPLRSFFIWYGSKRSIPRSSCPDANKQMLPIIFKACNQKSLNIISVTISSSDCYSIILDPGACTGKERIWEKLDSFVHPLVTIIHFRVKNTFPPSLFSNYVISEKFKISSLK